MAFEVIEQDSITPQRLCALLQLLGSLGKATRREILDTLQPTILIGEHEAREEIAARVFRAAISAGLISTQPDDDKLVALAVAREDVAEIPRVRSLLQRLFLNKTQEHQDHYLLNLFASWYTVQNEKVFEFSRTDVENRFNDQMYPGVETRVFRQRSDFNAWKNWAEFLGWGWTTFLGQRRDSQFVPDATLRLRPLVSQLLPDAGTDIPMISFMRNLSERCPELDGGSLFNRAWEACRGGEERGNQVSLMLSTALRVLDESKVIVLMDRSDAPTTWNLFPAQSHITRVTHIGRGEAF